MDKRPAGEGSQSAHKKQKVEETVSAEIDSEETVSADIGSDYVWSSSTEEAEDVSGLYDSDEGNFYR